MSILRRNGRKPKASVVRQNRTGLVKIAREELAARHYTNFAISEILDGVAGVYQRLTNQAAFIIADKKLENTKSAATFYSREEFVLLLAHLHKEGRDPRYYFGKVHRR